MNTLFRFNSLKTRLAFWFLLVSMLSLITVVTFLYFQRAEVIQGREFEKLKIVRDLKVRDLNDWLDERMSDLQMISKDDELRGIEKSLNIKKEDRTTKDLDTIAIARGLMLRYLRNYNAYHEVFFIDARSGRTVIQTNPSLEGRDKRDFSYFIEPMETRKPFIQDIYHSDVEQKPAMAFAAPVFCLEHDNEHLIGVVVMRTNLEQSLYPLLQNRIGAGETGETLIVNKDGFAINTLLFRENAPLKLKIKAEPAVRASRGETGIIETEDYRNELVLAAYTNIPLMKWGIVVKRDLAEVYAPIQAMRIDMVYIVLISLIIVLFVSILLSRSIARPVAGIGAIVRRFTTGDLDARYETEGTDEMATLGILFNKMAATLSTQITIQQRTSKLADTMVATHDMEKFASSLLIKLIDMSGSHMGAFYLINENEKMFEPIASIGLSNDKNAHSFSINDHEGELGQALVTGKVTTVHNISPNTVYTFKTTSGTVLPREIMTIPLIVDKCVMAVISLATLSSYSDIHDTIIKQSQLGMNITLANLMANHKTSILADELSARNIELVEQSKEMESQRDELQIQTLELEARRLQVEEADKLKSEFLSNMSHELRTPLNSIMSLSQLMISRGVDKDPDKAVEYLKVIDRNSGQLLNLINDILDLSKIESGRMDIYPTKFNVQQIIDHVLETITPIAQKKNILFETSIENISNLYSDQDKVYQILLNFCTNAVKFTEKGVVNVAVKATDDKVSFIVKDTGIGISDDDLGTIFDQFRQVDGSFTRAQEGTGLGLSISKKLAILLGGHIKAESTPGIGSTFTLTLPINIPTINKISDTNTALSSPPVESPHQTDEALSRQQEHINIELPCTNQILVVEDNEIASEQVVTALQENGFEVVTAKDGVEGLSLVKSSIPAGIILDLMMPRIDGFQVLEQIRSRPETAKIPVLILTAKEISAAERAKLADNNVQQLIQKGSADRDQLVASVKRLVGTNYKHLKKPAVKTVNSGTTKILLVEDNTDNQLTIAAILDDNGSELLIAENGKRGVQMASEIMPALILMDIQLPVLSGIDAIKMLKKNPTTKDIPIIAVTARAMKGDKSNIFSAGADDYISKPINPKELQEKVAKWMGGNKKQGNTND